MILAAFLSLLASDFEVSGATVSAFPIAVAEVSAAGPEGLAAASLRKRIEKMLALSGMFRVLDRKGFLAPATETDDMQAIQWAAWQQVGARGLLKLKLTAAGDQTTIQWRLFDPGTPSELTRGQIKRPTKATDGAAEAISAMYADLVLATVAREKVQHGHVRLAQRRRPVPGAHMQQRLRLAHMQQRLRLALMQQRLHPRLQHAWQPHSKHEQHAYLLKPVDMHR